MARLRKNLTQSEVADTLQIKHSTISRIEKYGAIHWSLFKLIQLTSLYHVSLFDLFTGNNQPCNAEPVAGGSIVLIGDDDDHFSLIKESLPEITVMRFSDNKEASRYLKESRTRLVIESHHEAKQGTDILKKLHASDKNNHTLSIVITNASNVETIKQVSHHENAIFFDEQQPASALKILVMDVLRVA